MGVVRAIGISTGFSLLLLATVPVQMLVVLAAPRFQHVLPRWVYGTAARLMGATVETALVVSAAHTLAMLATGGAMAFAIHAWLGLKFLSRTWFNLDVVWALSLVLVGIAGIWMAYAGH